MLGEEILHHVGRLRAVIGREARVAGVPVRHNGARLVGHARVATEHERRLHDRIGFCKTVVGLARSMHTLEREIVAELGMDDRRAGIERRLGVGHCLQLLVLDLDQLAGVLGFCARARDNRAHRLALPAGTLDRNRVLGCRFDAFEVGEHADPGRDHLRELGAGDDCDHARRPACRIALDPGNAGVRVGGAHERDMGHARKIEVAHVLCATLRETSEIGPRDRTADI